MEKAFIFMARLRVPGGELTPRQWLAAETIARERGNGTLRLTTRQTIQFHGTSDRYTLSGAAAIATLYRRRRADVYRFARHVSGSSSLADDVAQEVFMAVIHDAHRYRPGGAAVLPWLLGSATLASGLNDLIAGALIILLSIPPGTIRNTYRSWNPLIV